MRNKVVNALRSSKRRYFNNFDTDDKKKFWKTFKHLNKNQSQIPTLTHDGIEATVAKAKAEMLNKYFSECRIL